MIGLRQVQGWNIEDLLAHATIFEKELQSLKERLAPPSLWYPYGGAVSVLYNLSQTLTGARRDLRSFGGFGGSGRIADIGAADGDLAFFMESLGCSVDLIDNEATNFNKLEGARLLHHALESSVQIRSIDFNEQFELAQTYDLCFFLGILYHLKNPFYVLEKLAKQTQYLFLSTRIARFTPDKATEIDAYPLAYLVGTYETNNDATNFWMFSEAGLRQLIARTGWDVLDFARQGNLENSDPVSFEGDERAFCLLRSRSGAALRSEIPTGTYS